MQQTSSDYNYYFERYCRPLVQEPTAIHEVIPVIKDIEAVLFDVYGTLVISGSGDIGTEIDSDEYQDFAHTVQQELNLDIPEPESLPARLNTKIRTAHRHNNTTGCLQPEVEIRSIWKEMLEELFPEDHSIARSYAEQIALLYELSMNNVWPMPGSTEILSRLREDCKTGIVSNAQFYTPLTLSWFFGKDFSHLNPDYCVWSYLEGCAKPDPGLFLKALDKLKDDGVSAPEKVLYVGNDMLNDIAAAGSVGMKTILFAGDRRSLRLRENDSRVKPIQPDGIIQNLQQLILILGWGD